MAISETRRRQATAFGAAADIYDRGRPPYPDAAIDWLLAPGARRVLDLGAGTGKLTRQLRDRGLEVVAVEPLAEMRAELQRRSPEVETLAGAAEAIPLPDASLNAVLVAQAWHWVEPERAAQEVARVLRPGGRLGLVWNVRDERTGWVARLGDLMHRNEGQELFTTHPPVPAPLGQVERAVFPWVYRLDRETLIDLVASRSYVILMEPPQREALMDELNRFMDEETALAAGSLIELPYMTRCFRTHAPG